MTLSKSPVQRVGQGIFAHVADKSLVDLESGEVGGSDNGLLRVGRDNRGFVAGGVDELVVQDLDVGVVTGELGDLVGNGLGIGKGGNVLSDTSKAQDNVAAVGTHELRSSLLANEDEVGGGLAGAEGAADVTRETGVNTTAEALVGAADDVEGLLALGLERLGLGRLKDLTRGLTVLGGIVHGTLGAGELGRGDNLHGLGDLLDVANGLETALDFTQGCVAGGIVGDAGERGVELAYNVTMHLRTPLAIVCADCQH